MNACSLGITSGLKKEAHEEGVRSFFVSRIGSELQTKVKSENSFLITQIALTGSDTEFENPSLLTQNFYQLSYIMNSELNLFKK